MLEPHPVARASSTYILSEKEGYRFNTAAPYSLDAEAFEHLVDAGLEADEPHRLIVLEAARALYRGDYLPDDRGERDQAVAMRVEPGRLAVDDDPAGFARRLARCQDPPEPAPHRAKSRRSRCCRRPASRKASFSTRWSTAFSLCGSTRFS